MTALPFAESGRSEGPPEFLPEKIEQTESCVLEFE